jgi:hypothetical protein
LKGSTFDHIINGEGGEDEATSQFNLIKTPGKVFAPPAPVLHPVTSSVGLVCVCVGGGVGTVCDGGSCSSAGLCVLASDGIDEFVGFFSTLSAESVCALHGTDPRPIAVSLR